MCLGNIKQQYVLPTYCSTKARKNENVAQPKSIYGKFKSIEIPKVDLRIPTYLERRYANAPFLQIPDTRTIVLVNDALMRLHCSHYQEATRPLINIIGLI